MKKILVALVGMSVAGAASASWIPPHHPVVLTKCSQLHAVYVDGIKQTGDIKALASQVPITDWVEVGCF